MPAAPGPDAEVRRLAVAAKAARTLLEATAPETVKGCKNLGHEAAVSGKMGPRERLVVRTMLRDIGLSRGASHIRYFGDAKAQYYDCTIAAAPVGRASPPVPAPTTAKPPASPPLPTTAKLPGPLPVPTTAKPPASTPLPVPVATPAEPLPSPSQRVPAESPDFPAGALALQLELVPNGSLRVAANGSSSKADLAQTWSASGHLDYFLRPGVSIGIDPGVVFGLKQEGTSNSATQLDLRVRLQVGQLVARDSFALHSYATIGESWIIFPAADNGTPGSGLSASASGIIAGFGVAATIPLHGSQFVTLEVGYQFGWQSISIGTVDVDATSRFLHLGLGLGSYL